MERESFNDVLKAKEAEEERVKQEKNDGHIALDDAKRIKVLSPGQLVFKRFIRNKLAIFGCCVLIAMFLFSFICPIFYAYDQTDIFFKYDYTNGDYATVSVRSDYNSYPLEGSAAADPSVLRVVNSTIEKIEEKDCKQMLILGDDGKTYLLQALGEKDYILCANDGQKVATMGENQEIGTYDSMSNVISYTADDLGEEFLAATKAAVDNDTAEYTFGEMTYSLTKSRKFSYQIKSVGASVQYVGEKLGEDFEKAMVAAVENEENSFTVDDTEYIAYDTGKLNDIYMLENVTPVSVCSVMVFDAFETTTKVTDDFRISALLNAYNGETFEYKGESFHVIEEEGALIVCKEDGTQYGMLTNFVIRDTDGNDTFGIEFKEEAQSAISEMEESGRTTGTFTHQFEDKQTSFDGTEPILSGVYNEDGTPKMVDTPITITRKTGVYELTCNQWRHLIDLSASPSSRHVFGTDTDGMDILARMMYGGRISLLVGFIVVIIETVLGVILGGVAGYFGGWVDNLIMRLVDIFYCIPSLPILIILGSYMDEARLDPYQRLAWMMVVLGVLGWAVVARLVRGQILSLREQEFMVAAEATGVKVRHRIFRHLLPNVMPQLIVSATSGLGSVILTESTLSFLGLGVKHPLATWGTMINSVTASNENIIKFTYIWIPVGLLICLTVIAFNFVGDGLRDAFDPKMKR